MRVVEKILVGAALVRRCDLLPLLGAASLVACVSSCTGEEPPPEEAHWYEPDGLPTAITECGYFGGETLVAQDSDRLWFVMTREEFPEQRDCVELADGDWAGSSAPTSEWDAGRGHLGLLVTWMEGGLRFRHPLRINGGDDTVVRRLIDARAGDAGLTVLAEIQSGDRVLLRLIRSSDHGESWQTLADLDPAAELDGSSAYAQLAARGDAVLGKLVALDVLPFRAEETANWEVILGPPLTPTTDLLSYDVLSVNAFGSPSALRFEEDLEERRFAVAPMSSPDAEFTELLVPVAIPTSPVGHSRLHVVPGVPPDVDGVFALLAANDQTCMPLYWEDSTSIATTAGGPSVEDLPCGTSGASFVHQPSDGGLESLAMIRDAEGAVVEHRLVTWALDDEITWEFEDFPAPGAAGGDTDGDVLSYWFRLRAVIAPERVRLYDNGLGLYLEHER